MKRVLRLNKKEDRDQLVMSAMAVGVGGAVPMSQTHHLEPMMFNVLYSIK